jgi:hypothetical protein
MKAVGFWAAENLIHHPIIAYIFEEGQPHQRELKRLADGLADEDKWFWSDLDLERSNATIRRTLVWLKGGGWKFGEPKTSRSRRTVSFPMQLSRALLSHRREQAEARLKAA